MNFLLRGIIQTFSKRSTNAWSPATHPPRHSGLVEVEFEDYWARVYKLRKAQAYFDVDFREWSLEGVKSWRELS